MDYKLKSVLQKGMEIDYEYDFGSSTDLVIKVHDYRESFWKKEKLTILSRNNPLECEDCRKRHGCRQEMQLPVCNSPRMGVCAYEGSDIYPDQFMPDRNQ